MTDQDRAAIASDLLIREAMLLDDRCWDDWLDLYTEDAVYWVPAWLDESTETSDPDREISQIYHDSRSGLEERVSRVRSGTSVTTMPLPRTTHYVGNILIVNSSNDSIEVRANWMVQVFQPRTTKHYVNFGHYDIKLVPHQTSWRIAGKTIHLKNDLVPALIDFYTL